MKVLITGGRNYWNRRKMHEVLSSIHKDRPITLIIEGDATGADRLGRFWAAANSIKYNTYPAKWYDLDVKPLVIKYNTFGRAYNAAAGNIRNQYMIDVAKPDLAVAFPGNSGTLDAKERIRKAGIELIEVEDE